jgi:osmotically-inducible protein OsmY
MDTRQRNVQLESIVLLALWKSGPQAFFDVTVKATPEGIVYLRGRVSSLTDCTLLTRIVSEVPGVKQVFCNVAAHERREANHA